MRPRLLALALLNCTTLWTADTFALDAPTAYATSQTNGTIGAYNTATGTASNTALVSGLSKPSGIALFDGKLYVADANSNTVDVYDATTGVPVQVPLISGLNAPCSVAVSGSDLYVANFGANSIGKYSRIDGTVENASLITGLHAPAFVTVDGTDLYVSNQGDGSIGAGTIGKYSTDGTPENTSFISGLSAPGQTAVVNGSIYFPNYALGTVGVYDASTGETINDSLITGLDFPWSLAITGSTLLVGDLIAGSVGSYDLDSGNPLNSTLFSGVPRVYALAVTPIAVNHAVSVIASRHASTSNFAITNHGNVTTSFRLTLSTQGATAKRPRHSKQPWVSISYGLGGEPVSGSTTQATPPPIRPGQVIVLTTKLRVRGGPLATRKRITTSITASDLSAPSATAAAKTKVQLAAGAK